MTEDNCISMFFQGNFKSALTKSTSRVPPPPPPPPPAPRAVRDAHFGLSQHPTVDEREPLDIRPFYNITPRAMPASPHCVVEEQFAANPWAMLIATIFLTKTSGKIARPYMKSFFEEYPTPYHVLSVSPSCLERCFDSLGLRKRGGAIWKLTYQFVSSKWRRASDLYGIGKYGEDAYRIFCLGHTDLDPGDRYLRLYLDWLRGHTDFLEDNGVADSEYIINDPVLKYHRVTLREGANLCRILM